MKNLLSLTVLLLLSTTIFAQSYKIEYKFKEGETYKYQSNMKGSFVQEVMQQEMKIKTDGKTFVKLFADKVAQDGKMNLHASIDSGKVSTSTPMMDTTMSLDMLKDKRTEIIISPNGKIISKNLIDTLGGDLQSMGVNQNETMQFFTLPEKEVKQGDTWNGVVVDSVSLMGGVIVNKTDVNYKLIGEENKDNAKVLKIEFNGSTESNGNTTMMGQELFIEGKGRMNGFFFFDPAKGIMTSSTTNVDNQMTMATTGSSNMIIPMTQAVTVDYSLVK